MHSIQIFVEMHWAVARPEIRFFLNDTPLDFSVELFEKNGYVERAIFTTAQVQLQSKNTLAVEMFNKVDSMITEETDHWVDVKNIVVAGISADRMLYQNTSFYHTMPADWVEHQRAQGYVIEDVYSPCTQLHLNGKLFYPFDQDFFLEKVLFEWQN